MRNASTTLRLAKRSKARPYNVSTSPFVRGVPVCRWGGCAGGGAGGGGGGGGGARRGGGVRGAGAVRCCGVVRRHPAAVALGAGALPRPTVRGSRPIPALLPFLDSS